jgi:23S rRNA (cytosine1962-C5)-methyltransferase
MPSSTKQARDAKAGKQDEAPTAPQPAPAQSIHPTPASRLPTATISRRAADRLHSGHVWVYISDILGINPGDAPAGLVHVHDQANHLLGTALWSPTSQIALRLLSSTALDEQAWLALLRTRLSTAIADRQPLLDATTDSCRLIFSEADALPGIIADKYGDLVILQLLAAGVDNAAVRSTVVEVLRQELAPNTIVERPDPRIREIEQLSAPDLAPLYAADPANPLASTVFRLNNLHFHYDTGAGQKTGAFLDQRDNYAAAARYGQGEALDVCTYQGGFALHLATTCRRVTGIDSSQPALEVAERNLELNRETLGAVEVDWVKGDAFAILREWSEQGAAYDTIVLDPPAFAKTKRAAESAMRGYKELNLRAFKMLRPGGTLLTCSCSHHVSLPDFEAVVTSAAADTNRRVRLLERRGAAPDHPVILTIPETEYLKCLILRVE